MGQHLIPSLIHFQLILKKKRIQMVVVITFQLYVQKIKVSFSFATVCNYCFSRRKKRRKIHSLYKINFSNCQYLYLISKAIKESLPSILFNVQQFIAITKASNLRFLTEVVEHFKIIFLDNCRSVNQVFDFAMKHDVMQCIRVCTSNSKASNQEFFLHKMSKML